MKTKAQAAKRSFLSAGPVLALVLVVVTLAVYWPVRHNGFVDYDDPIYLLDNPHIQQGLTGNSVRWAFTTYHANFWHPLTWLSLAADWRMFGPNPAGHHVMAAVWHTANTAMLFWALLLLTGSRRRSALVAMLFALHPMHVESVAWASERKDLLSTFFWFAALAAYAVYARVKLSQNGGKKFFHNAPFWYALVLALFILGMMAKPMLVTFPFALLLLDFWPLQRIVAEDFRHKSALRTKSLPLVLEKLPFFAVAAAGAALAYHAQNVTGAVTPLRQLPLSARLEGAFIGYMRYIGKTFWPDNLAIPYPVRADWPDAAVAASIVAFLLLCLLAAALWRRAPYITTGWFWFAGTLVPVIGLVHVGVASIADRYTYVPHVGFFVALVWGADAAARRFRFGPQAAWATALAALVGCAILTRQQIACWKDTYTLFSKALNATRDNYIAEFNVAKQLCDLERFDEALVHYRNVLRINPENIRARNNLAGLAFASGNREEARDLLREALLLAPKNVESLRNMAWLLATAPDPKVGNGPEALIFARRAVELTQSNDLQCLAALDAAYARSGDFPNAIRTASNVADQAQASGKHALAAQAGERLRHYRIGRPFLME